MNSRGVRAMIRFIASLACMIAATAQAQQPTCTSSIASAFDAYEVALTQLEQVQAQCVPNTPPPVPNAWPNASTTGPAAGVQLVPCAAGNITSSKSGCAFTGAITIAASNVTITDSVITAPLAASYAISGAANRTGTVLQRVRVSGAGGKCIYLQGGFAGDRLDISGCEDGVFGSRFTLERSYIHDVLTGGDRHSDGVQIPSGGQVVLRGNRIEVARGAANSAVFVQSNFGVVDNVLAEANRLGGGTYTVYTDAQGYACPVNVRWRGNVFVRGSSAFGVGNVPCKTAAGFEWANNVYDDGAPVVMP